ncbi:MAG TPA: hypothetical protein DCQ98_10105 [Planctomycetaceae bacterium]|nr:hypothetical protein [Planctomycetaceae bacterium]HRF00710.1 PEP-CTERM sorting domain-containing protein [Pirellulaceae bacterium]
MKMRLQKNFGRALAVALIGFGLAGSADAQILTNGGFETGDTSGWSTTAATGGVVIAESSVAKKRSPGTWEPVSGSGPNTHFALLSGTTNDIADGQVQTIFQDTAFLTTDGTLTFRYFFDSAEPSSTWNDSFSVQVGVWNSGTNSFSDLADSFTVRVSDLSTPSGDTGWLTRSVELAAGSSYRILGTLVNASFSGLEHGGIGSDDFTSIAGLDDFVFTEAPPAVPEPTSMTLLLAGGAIGLVLRARRKAKQAPPSES